MSGPQANTTDVEADRPPRLDPARYPFESRWLDLPEGRVHYVDEGAGRPVVFVHGNPTWSFLYRHLLAGLSGYRRVALDHLGFGLSETPQEFGYRPADHARVFERFVGRLDLDDAVLVGHDWGGPIALDYATRHPDDVAGLVLSNTWGWPRDRLRDRALNAGTRSRLWRRLVLRYDAFAQVAVAPLVVSLAARKGWRHAAEIRRHYLAPLDSPADRIGTWVLAREVVGSHEWLERLWKRRGTVADKPALLVWGRRDPVHGSMLRRWQALFEDASTVSCRGVGHFVPEELGTNLVPAVRSVLGGKLEAAGRGFPG